QGILRRRRFEPGHDRGPRRAGAGVLAAGADGSPAGGARTRAGEGHGLVRKTRCARVLRGFRRAGAGSRFLAAQARRASHADGARARHRGKDFSRSAQPGSGYRGACGRKSCAAPELRRRRRKCRAVRGRRQKERHVSHLHPAGARARPPRARLAESLVPSGIDLPPSPPSIGRDVPILDSTRPAVRFSRSRWTGTSYAGKGRDSSGPGRTTVGETRRIAGIRVWLRVVALPARLKRIFWSRRVRSSWLPRVTRGGLWLFSG